MFIKPISATLYDVKLNHIFLLYIRWVVSFVIRWKVLLCLGHYASQGFRDPLRSKDSKRLLTVELIDYATLRRNRRKVISSVMSFAFPHPTKYRLVWQFARGGNSLFAWKAQPPEGFLALGMLCTTSGIVYLKCILNYKKTHEVNFTLKCCLFLVNPPDLKAMRCVPSSWCVPTSVPPRKIWDDTGSGGGKAASIWAINSMDMICVVTGHDAPNEAFFDLNLKSFSLSGLLG